ncbi:MAG: hypothetical protein AAF654_08950 [Myxococcota bacterium]
MNNQIEILGAAVLREGLFIDVQYSGGCFEHAFSLEWDGQALKTNPPQYPLNLVDESRTDGCRAIQRRTLQFDISTPSLQFQSSGTLLLSVPGGREVPVPIP